MRAAHEAGSLGLWDLGGSPTKGQLARSILPLLEESRQSGAQFGPTSELARSRPHDEAAHAVWKAERLSVIVPNNRKIAALLNDFAGDFEADEQVIVRSEERRVGKECVITLRSEWLPKNKKKNKIETIAEYKTKTKKNI